MSERYRVVGAGYDEIHLCFPMEGSPSVGRMARLGRDQGRKIVLGSEGSFGKWEHLFGRSYAYYMKDTQRLFIQWHPTLDTRELLKPDDYPAAFKGLQRRMAIVGLDCFEEPWATRIDVTVDVKCKPEDGKALLDGLEAARLPNGLRVETRGKPRSTVYFMARASNNKLARAYCKNIEQKSGEPYGWIRLEVEERFKNTMWPANYLEKGTIPAEMLWKARFGPKSVSGRVERLDRETQVLTLSQRVQLGEISTSAFERMNTFLDCERLGIARNVYSPRVYSERKREARSLGLSVNDVGEEPVEFDLDVLHDIARQAWGSTQAA